MSCVSFSLVRKRFNFIKKLENVFFFRCGSWVKKKSLVDNGRDLLKGKVISEETREGVKCFGGSFRSGWG